MKIRHEIGKYEIMNNLGKLPNIYIYIYKMRISRAFRVLDYSSEYMYSSYLTSCNYNEEFPYKWPQSTG
jgi:hypothetical protein